MQSEGNIPISIRSKKNGHSAILGVAGKKWEDVRDYLQPNLLAFATFAAMRASRAARFL